MRARFPAKRSMRAADLLRPHAAAFFLAMFAAVGQTVADLLEPWPLKIVIDTAFRSRATRDWVNEFLSAALGEHQWAVVEFAALAVLVIAAIGAICSYSEKYLTTNIGQWVAHDLRQMLYSHIQRLSLAYHDRKRTGDLISRVTSDIDAIQSFIASGILGGLINSLALVGMVGMALRLSKRSRLTR